MKLQSNFFDSTQDTYMGVGSANPRWGMTLALNILQWILIEGLSLAGGPDNQVHFEGYQVSNQCMALVRDECLLPCKDAPELGYAKESSSEQYVPDVFYKVKMRWYQKRKVDGEQCGHWPILDVTNSGAFWPWVHHGHLEASLWIRNLYLFQDFCWLCRIVWCQGL